MEDNNTSGIVIDETYEFSAPTYYDFVVGESEEDVRNAEDWFDTALAHAPSPFMMRIKSARSVQLNSQCEFGGAEHATQASESFNPTSTTLKATEVSPTEPHIEMEENLNPNNCNEKTHEPDIITDQEPVAKCLSTLKATEVSPTEPHTEMEENLNPNNCNEKTHEPDIITNQEPVAKSCEVLCDKISKDDDRSTVEGPDPISKVSNIKELVTADVCTPKPAILVGKGVRATADSKKQQTAKKIASTPKNPSTVRSKIQSHTKAVKSSGSRRDVNMKSSVGTPNFVQENQAIKKQKLEDGKTRQILNIKPPSLPHKTRPGATNNSLKLSSSTAKPSKENRKMYVREPATPYVSMAEMMKKFQSSTRDVSLPHNSATQEKLTLTRPKEPDFVTSQRVRLVKVKSSAEIEEEMLAKMPKFKARPLNKKILEAPALPPLPKSQPPKPEFQEFHLKTMERASKNADASSVVSMESGHQKSQWKTHHLTEPKTPVLHTLLRARPTNVKSSLEIEQEELEKIPKFKARPLNKKIFESKGELGLFCNDKKQVTVPKEFHFAIDERIPPSSTVADLFDKLSLNSEPNTEKNLPRLTRPNPFNLYTQERGAQKERRLITELVHKQMEEERARVPKATPYPYTTDYPVIPPKPEPKQCTRPEPFQLESLIRHEEELRREMEELRRLEIEEAQKRIFKAQPVLKEDPIPLPEKDRKPLTEVQEFNLHVEHRAEDRAEFDKKIKEKEMMYKRYREEAEAEKQMEEEKALKQMRRMLVPHARPVPNFANPFIPQKSCKEPTKPKSPKFRVRSRKERKASPGTNLQAAYSAAAALMR